MHQKPKPEPNPNNGWSFFTLVENPPVKTELEVYVHPMVKRSASALSTVSLEMCTESLGTETGSDLSDVSDVGEEEREKFSGLHRSKSKSFSFDFDRKMARMVRTRGGGSGFPPPLTSISGSEGRVKVRPYREGGRLVIKAVSVSDCGIKFEAQRTNGRLCLSLWRTCVNYETGRGEMENEGGGGRRETGGGRRKTAGELEVRSPEWKSTEMALTKCKDGGNGNKGIGNWSLFRVVIS